MMPLPVLVLFLALAGNIHAKAIDNKRVTGGYFTLLDPNTRAHRRLHRYDIDRLGKDENGRIKLFLDNGLSFDIRVFTGSVWTKDSTLVVRNDPQSEEVHYLDGNCFLHGKIVDYEGVANIDRCGPVTGTIYFPGHRYDFEEDTTELHGKALTFKVTKKEKAQEDVAFESSQIALGVEEREAMEQIYEGGMHYNKSSIGRDRREAYDVTIEIALVMDSNYTDYLYFELDLDTHAKMFNFMLSKWMMVQAVLGDAAAVGAQVKIAVKRIDIWWSDPVDYPRDYIHIHQHNRWFCRTPAIPAIYDLKVLYIKTSNYHQIGSAFSNGMCAEFRNCMLVKSPTQRVWMELHQLGHTLGLHHDNRMDDCERPRGFMSWQDTYRFLPCYKRVLMTRFGQDSSRCLYERNNVNINLLDPNETRSTRPTTSAPLVESTSMKVPTTRASPTQSTKNIATESTSTKLPEWFSDGDSKSKKNQHPYPDYFWN